MAAFDEGGRYRFKTESPILRVGRRVSSSTRSVALVLIVPSLVCERQAVFFALLQHTESKKFESNPQKKNLARRPRREYRAQMVS
eukprot:scaffold587760_cov18-Prasinocladus_malaysianus.AAC.1